MTNRKEQVECSVCGAIMKYSDISTHTHKPEQDGLDELIEEMLAQPPALVASEELAKYKARVAAHERKAVENNQAEILDYGSWLKEWCDLHSKFVAACMGCQRSKAVYWAIDDYKGYMKRTLQKDIDTQLEGE